MAIAMLAGLVTFALFFALSWASLGADPARLRASVQSAFERGDLKPEASWLFGDTDIGVHQFNDCLILGQALDDRATRLERAVSPLSVIGETDNACAALGGLANRQQ